MAETGTTIPITRLAPSPTGALHLGNARTFLVNWAIARQRGWRVLMRIDDLEGPRVKAGADVQAMEDLRWLGLDWEEPVVYQSRRSADYEAALLHLKKAGLTYACACTRSDLEREDVLAAPDGSRIYSGRCRQRRLDERGAAGERSGRRRSIRFRITDNLIRFTDGFLGEQQFDPPRELGDFVIRKADGEYGYQLATVIDDSAAGVTHVVRGEDLLASTPRQLMIYEALGLADQIPQYMHLPLIVGPDRRKLAKRHGDTRLHQLREEGVTAGQIRRLLGTWSGLPGAAPEASIDEWIETFDLSRLPREPVVYDDTRDRPRALP